jgi:hypothetical protein
MLSFIMLGVIMLSFIILSIIMLSAIMLSAIKMSVIMLGVIMLSVIRLIVIMWNAVAPMREGHDEIGATILRRITLSITVKVDTKFKMNEVLILTIEINQQPFSATRWQHGSQICFAIFI